MAAPTPAGSPLDRFLTELLSLLEGRRARAAYVFGSWARGEEDALSDIDAIVVAWSAHPPVDRFRDYLPAIVAAGVGVDLFVYTPEEFETMRSEGRPFLLHALEGARLVYEG